MEDIISLRFVEITPSETTDLINKIFQEHHVNYQSNEVMSVLTDKKQINMKVVDTDQADFVVLIIDASLLLEFEASIGCFSSQIHITYNEEYLLKILNFASEYPKYSRKVRFLITHVDELEFSDQENHIKELIMENSSSYVIYPNDIYFEGEYKRLIADISQIYQSQK